MCLQIRQLAFIFVASWYQPPDSKVDELELLKNQLEKDKTLHNGNETPQSMFWVILTSEILFGQIYLTNKVLQ